MKTTSLILVALLAALLFGPALGQGTTLQTITWTGTTNDILTLNVAHPLGATASSGLPVSLRVEAGPAKIADGTITINGVGTVWVSAEQAGDPTFWPVRLTRSLNARGVSMTRVSEVVNDGLGLAAGVEVVGNYAYVANYGTWDGAKYVGSGLQVFDVSNPANPRRVGEAVTAGMARQVQVLGIHAYVATAGTWDGAKYVGSGLQVIDVSNPANPVWVGGIDLNGGLVGVEVVGNYAYVAALESGLVIIDVKHPANPVPVGAYDTGGMALGVRVLENHAFVADGAGGLVVLEVSNPANPVRVGGLLAYANDVDVVGNYAYLTEWDGGLEVIDVSNPANPIRVSKYNTFIVVSGVRVLGAYAYLSGKFGLQVIDVSNPAEPLSAGVYDAGGNAGGVQVLGNKAYVAYWNAGFQILDVRLAYPQTFIWPGETNGILALNVSYPLPTAKSGLPVTLRVDSGPADVANGTITVTGRGTVVVTAEQLGDTTYLPSSDTRSFNVGQAVFDSVGGYDRDVGVSGVQVVGNYAYIVGAGLQVINVSQPANPVRLAGVDFGGEAYGVEVVGNYAYVAAGDAGLQVVDVTNPTSPIKVGGYDTSGVALAVRVAGTYAYVADRESGLHVIDVSNPANPLRVGGYQTNGSIEGVQVVGHYAYLAAEAVGLIVVDVSNPASPVRVGGVDLYEGAFGIEVVGHYAYVGGPSTLRVIDVSNPAKPVWVNESESESDKGGYVLLVMEKYAYLGQNDGSSLAVLGVVDVSNPKKPVKVGNGGVGLVTDVQVVEEYAYVAGRGGLEILELRLGYPQTLEFQLPAEIPLQGQPILSAATSTSELPLTFSVQDGPALVVNDQLLLTGLGPVTLKAEQAGNDDFLPISEVWTFTVIRPRIGVRLAGGQVELHWSAGLAGFKLQVAESLTPSSQWDDITALPVEADGEASLHLDWAAPQSYFRLFKP